MISNTVMETAKLALRKSLIKANLGVTRDPAAARLARTIRGLEIQTVVDVGANVGQFAALLRTTGYSGRIVSLEPLPQAFQHLERRSRRASTWHCLNVAVGETVGQVTINIAENSYSSSALAMTDLHLSTAPKSRYVGTVKVPMTTVKDLAERYALDPQTTFLKIDTQGYEGPVLKGCGSDFLASVRGVQVELSMATLYEGQLLFDDLRGVLRDHGLTLFSIEPGIADTSGRMLQCDGLFVREES